VGVRRTRDPGARRRGIALGAAALLAFVVGLAAGAGNGDPEREGAVARGPGQGPVPRMPQRPTAEPRRAGRRADAAPAAAVARLSLRQRVGELIVFAFAGPALPAYAADILREGRAAGVILFGPNVQSPAQLRGLTAAVQRAAGGDALVAADQEGGAIRIVRYAPPAAGEARQADPAAAGAAARAAARGLRRAGVNVNLAPVVDVPSGEGSIMVGRAWPGGVRGVTAAARAAVPAYAPAGVAATAKHFPGLGGATTNTDEAPATVRRTHAELAAADLVPFRAAIARDVPIVMASHALYPALDPARIASQSPRVLVDLLRRDLRFGGVAMTDSLEADAVIARSSVATAAVRSIRAGADVALLTGPGSYPAVYRRLVATARRDPAFRARVDDAAARVLALKRRLEL